MALIYEVDFIDVNGANSNIVLVDPAEKPNNPGGGVEVDFQYVSGGDVNGDGNMDVGDTFEVSFDGGLTWYTATTTFYYDPNASSDSDLLGFTVNTGGGDVQYALNTGSNADPGETDPFKIYGGRITQGHANNGQLLTGGGGGLVCFVRGTYIQTAHGPVAIEDLSVGDVVPTADNGDQVIRWIGSTKVRASGRFAPIRIAAGALGENLPSEDLLVSPAHRMVLNGWRTELLFAQSQVLAAASSLVNDSSITVARSNSEVEYFHIMFDKHEIITANGALSESFNPTVDALDKLSEASRDELFALFPELQTMSAMPMAALPTLSGAEAKLVSSVMASVN